MVHNKLGKVTKSEHLTYFGEIPNMEKSTAVNFKETREKRTIPILQNNMNKMTWKPDTTSGLFLWILTKRHHFQERIKLYVPKETSFPIPLKYMDVVWLTNTTLDVLRESQINDWWNVDGDRELSGPWTGFIQFTSSNTTAPKGIHVVLREIYNNSSNVEARKKGPKALSNMSKISVQN